MAAKTVDGYIAGLQGWQKEVVTAVRGIILDEAPQAQEAYKWAQPVYESNGPFAYMKAFKNSVNFGFWRGVDLEDPQGILQGSGDKMRHVKLAGTEDIDEPLFRDFIRQAIALNAKKGDPTKGG